jgi:hypothetical protein
MMQEVDESLGNLLQAAEQMLQELVEEARAIWEERAVYYASRVTNLVGEAFEALDEKKWSGATAQSTRTS